MLFALPILFLLMPAPLTAIEQQPVVPAGESRGVLLDIVARDHHGRLVRDLNASDLHITDAGSDVKPISFRLVAPGDAPAAGHSAPPRLITLLFERFGPDGRALAREGALALLKSAAGPGVYFGVLSTSASIEIEQPFTSDTRLVQAAIERATSGARKKDASRIEETLAKLRREVAVADGSAQSAVLARILLNVADPTVEAARREALGTPSLQALAGLAREQRAVPGRKTLVYFSEGLQVPESQRPVFAGIIEIANRSNLSIYPVDVSGLAPEEPSFPSPPTTGMNLNQSMGAGIAMANIGIGAGNVHRLNVPGPKAHDRGTLLQLAAETGGFLVSNTNAVAKPARRIAEEAVTYYEVTYVPAAAPLDGQFRPVAVTTARPDVVVRTRSGYLSLPLTSGTPMQSFEVPLLKQLDLQPAPHDFYHASAILPLRAAPAGVEHALLVEGQLGDLTFDDDSKAGVSRVHASVLAVVRDAAGKIVDRFSLDDPFQGPLDRKESYRKAPWKIEERLVLAPGAYTLETVVADVVGKRTSVVLRSFKVEPWSRGPHVSGLVYARNVLAAKGNGRRVFQTSGKTIEPQLELHLAGGAESAATVFFLARGAEGSTSPVKVDLVLEKGGWETARALVYEGALTTETALLSKLDAATLAGGEYSLSVEVSQDGQKSTASLPLSIDDWKGGVDAGGKLKVASGKPAEWNSSPPNAAQRQLIEAARGRALGYTEKLPNFVCLQTTRRLEDPTGAEEWRQKDEYSEIITWYNGKEAYGQVAGRGRPKGKNTDKVRVTSAGEFGSLLRTVFLAESKADFRWLRSESIAGRSADVFSYEIASANSQYHINYLGKHSYHATPAYHGLVSIDSNTAEVLHLEAEMGELPDEIRVDELHITVNYDIANVAGRDFLLPSEATLATKVGNRHLVRNEMRFTGFRRFDTETNIRYNTPPSDL